MPPPPWASLPAPTPCLPSGWSQSAGCELLRPAAISTVYPLRQRWRVFSVILCHSFPHRVHKCGLWVCVSTAPLKRAPSAPSLQTPYMCINCTLHFKLLQEHVMLPINPALLAAAAGPSTAWPCCRSLLTLRHSTTDLFLFSTYVVIVGRIRSCLWHAGSPL